MNFRPFRLFKAYAVESCQITAGLATPDLAGCMPQPGSNLCKDFFQTDCEMLGKVVSAEEDVESAQICQNILNVVGFAYDANAFEYDEESNDCRLLSDGGRGHCAGFGGPKTPNYWEDCPLKDSPVPIDQQALIVGMGNDVETGPGPDSDDDLVNFQIMKLSFNDQSDEDTCSGLVPPLPRLLSWPVSAV